MLGFTHIPKLVPPPPSFNLKRQKAVTHCITVFLSPPPQKKKKENWHEYQGTRENIPQIFGYQDKMDFFLHTFPKLVSPTPRLTLKPLPNGAQTPPVFLYFSTYFEFTPNKVTISISALDVSQIMLKFF